MEHERCGARGAVLAALGAAGPSSRAAGSALRVGLRARRGSRCPGAKGAESGWQRRLAAVALGAMR